MNYEYLILGMLIVIMLQLAYIVFLLTRNNRVAVQESEKQPKKFVEEDEEQPAEWVPKPMTDDQDERMAKFHNLWPHNR